MATRAYIRLKSYCRLQSGREGYAIFNLERGNYAFIPQTIHAVLTVHSQFTLSELEQITGSTGKLATYIDHLIANDYLFETTDPDRYPATSDDWQCPELVLATLLEVGTSGAYDLWAVLDQLQALSCKHAEIRLLDGVDSALVEQCLHYTANSTFRTIDLVMNWATAVEEGPVTDLPATLDRWLTRYPKLSRLLLYGSPSSTTIPQLALPLPVVRTARSLTDLQTDEALFATDKLYISMPFYTESLRFNPFYNRKVCVAADGSIKNCLTHARSFGHADTDSLALVAARRDFQRLWYRDDAQHPDLTNSVFRYVRLARLAA